MGLTIYCLNSFVKTAVGGNPAGVVLEADRLADQEMLAIARQVGFSEIAFIQKSDRADFEVRFFTPSAEVDLCGHATIAAFTLLRNKGLIGGGQFQQETKAGMLGITVTPNRIFMEQKRPIYDEIINKAELEACLNITHNDFLADLPAQIVSTGLRDLIVPLKNLTALLSIKPNLKQISVLCKKYGLIGLHVFSLETKWNSIAHCRNFAPLYNINEESATGTSNGALACFLYAHGVVNPDQVSNLVFEQGYSMGKPSEIVVALSIFNDQINEVQVGGTAIMKQVLQI